MPRASADVTVTVRVFPLDGSPVIEREFSGQANAYGYYHPGDSLRFDVPGEYVIDYEARYTTPEGQLWAASQRSAGVIGKPDTQLVLHGRRGLDGYYPELRPAWFNTNRYPLEDVAVPSILNFPYFSGDVAWVEDDAQNGIRPIIQAQDIDGTYENWLMSTLAGYISPMERDITQLAGDDALPLISVLGGPPGPYSPALLPELTVNQAYAYISAVRPGVTVRQFIQGSDDEGLIVSWDTEGSYNGQPGVGSNGDQPGDFTFLFGGAVLRNAEAGIQDSAIYAALAVTTDTSHPLGSRVYPPYLGETGGAEGGPLLTIGGQQIETFFHLTGAQPGQVFSTGDTLAIAGQVAPTLASDVRVTITSPSGIERHFEGTANAIGYFYDPANDLVVDEPGVWQVLVTVIHTGRTSAGQVDAPYPSGGILGVGQGVFPVYVIPSDALPLDWSQGGPVDRATPPGSAINFQLTIPGNWTDTKAYRTITMPGYLLDNGEIQVFGSTATYQYNPAQLNREFPNFEIAARASGPAASDVLTLTFVVTGQDENGTFQARSRSFAVFHDRLVSLETGSSG